MNNENNVFPSPSALTCLLRKVEILWQCHVTYSISDIMSDVTRCQVLEFPHLRLNNGALSNDVTSKNKQEVVAEVRIKGKWIRKKKQFRDTLGEVSTKYSLALAQNTSTQNIRCLKKIFQNIYIANGAESYQHYTCW